MLDTDTCIRVTRDRPQGAEAHFAAHRPGLCVSTVTVMELMFGAEKSLRQVEGRNQVARFLSRLTVLDYDAEAAGHSAQVRAVLRAPGQEIGPYDLLIAGHARSRGLVVVTGNRREFDRVEGLRCETW